MINILIGTILAALILFALYIIISAYIQMKTQQRLDMENTFKNSLKRAEQLAYIWFFEIQPTTYPKSRLINFVTPCGEYWDGLPMIDIPKIQPGYLKKYHRIGKL